MNRQQYDAVTAILRDESLNEAAKITEINQVLGTNLTDPDEAAKVKSVVIGDGPMIITNNANGTVAVSFNGVEVTGSSFAIAFILTLLNVLTGKALDKFLPQEKPEPATGSRRESSGSPASARDLAIGGNRSY